MSISSGGDNSNTRFSLGASSTDGIVKNTGIDKYTASFNNSNDFFGGVLKIDTNLLYAGLKDETTLISNDAGYIGNLIGTALYWNPTLPIYQPDGSYTYVGDDYLNPVQLLNAYDDHTQTNKVLGSIAATLKLGSHFQIQIFIQIELSNSTRKRQLYQLFVS